MKSLKSLFLLLLIPLIITPLVVLAQAAIPEIPPDLLENFGLVAGICSTLGVLMRAETIPIPNEWISWILFGAGLGFYIWLTGSISDPRTWAYGIFAAGAANGFTKQAVDTVHLATGKIAKVMPKNGS